MDGNKNFTMDRIAQMRNKFAKQMEKNENEEPAKEIEVEKKENNVSKNDLKTDAGDNLVEN